MATRSRATPFVAALLLAPLALGPVLGADVETATLTTGDGAKLGARFFPSAQQGGKSPAVIVLDDLGDDARPAICDDIAGQLAKEGCAVLCLDFRGQGRSRKVEPEFWDDPNNQKLVKGYKADDSPEEIRFADFKPGYLPTLVNDVAAARAHLERRNDARECNISQIYIIGYGRGAAIGQLWLASEWSRYRVTGFQAKLASRPDGRDVAGCVWVGPKMALDARTVPMLDLMKRAEAKRSTFLGLLYDAKDGDGERLARQCEETFNLKGKAPLVATRAVPHETKSLGGRGEVPAQVVKLIMGMQKAQELPPWGDRSFGDRRYVWAFRGAPLVDAKDEGEYQFYPVPVELMLKR
ncbi:MAG TPA: hypothetical protein VGE74_16240 [Gemmata sp.]